MVTIDDWNKSDPHEDGRLIGRSQGKETFTVSELKNK
jgi:hypothetical protein